MAHTWAEIQPAGNADKAWRISSMSDDGSKIIAGVYNGRLYLGTEAATGSLLKVNFNAQMINLTGGMHG